MSDNPPYRLREFLRRLCAGDESARPELEAGLREVERGEYAEALARWKQARSRGGNVSPEELCRGNPASAPTVAELIRLVDDAYARLGATATASPAEAADGPLPEVPGYDVLALLGRGGMGVVYQARQLGFNRVVALKMVRAGAGADAAERARFRVEAEAVARMRHPHIVQVHDIGEANGCPYFSMEYLAGGSLSQSARAEPLEPRRAAEVVEALARGMQHAHAAGVIHRDLKPANVLLDADGTPKVADFGLARLLDGDGTRTASEVVLGTACYMAPEQAAGRGGDIGPATDVYGLGAILYDLLTGRPPIERASWEVMLERVRTQEPPDPSRLRRGVGRDLEAVCLKCLHKRPDRRYASAQALADDLRRWLDGKPTAARPLGPAGRLGRFARRRPATSLLGLLLLFGAIGALLARHYGDPDRVPNAHLAELERMQEVSLVGPTGPPAWRRDLYGPVEVWPPDDRDQTFTISSLGKAYVELLPATPARGYRYRAELRHVDGDWGSAVGVYFAREAFATSKGTEHCFCLLTFNDRVRGFAQPGGERGNNLDLELRRRLPDGAVADTGSGVGRVFRTAADQDPAARPWRTLEVVVTGELVRVCWDNGLVGQVAPARMAERFQRDVNGAGEPGLRPTFGPGGALGLFVAHGRVSVRNVSVGPVGQETLHD
jgi:serine/threonine-protein kinase